MLMLKREMCTWVCAVDNLAARQLVALCSRELRCCGLFAAQ